MRSKCVYVSLLNLFLTAPFFQLFELIQAQWNLNRSHDVQLIKNWSQNLLQASLFLFPFKFNETFEKLLNKYQYFLTHRQISFSEWMLCLLFLLYLHLKILN